MTIKQATDQMNRALAGLYPASEIRQFAHLFFGKYMSFSSIDILTRHETELPSDVQRFFDDALARMVKGEPVQYVLGEAWFGNLVFEVAKGVLIPRPETEELVEWIISEVEDAQDRILDIGTGSGCIAVSLAHALPKATVEAWDISPDALTIATRNADRLGTYVTFVQRDVLKVKPEMIDNKYDIVVSNPPYVRNSEKAHMHVNVLEYEPHLALFVDDDDALLFYRVIAKLAFDILNPEGKLFFEINEALGGAMRSLLEKKGFTNVELRADIFGKERMIMATKP
jgi:release factor glutamine methyltransferase